MFTGTSTTFNVIFPIPNIGDTFEPATGEFPFEDNQCFERINYNPSYTEYYNTPEGYDGFFGIYESYTDCLTCQASNACVETDVSLSGCCDGLVYNVVSI